VLLCTLVGESTATLEIKILLEEGIDMVAKMLEGNGII
jgi:hypothetical protein